MSTWGRTAMKWVIGSLLFVFVGFLPLWFSIYVIVAGGQDHHRSSEYWAVAPWGVFFGAALCSITLPVAALPVFAYHLTRGDGWRKFRFAAASFAIAITLMASVISGYLHLSHRRQVAVTQEKAAVREFVQNDPRVQGLFVEDYEVAPPQCAEDRKHNLVYCDVSAYPASATFEERFKQAIYAVVDVAHPGGTLSLSLKCVTRLSPGDRDSRNRCDGALPLD
jgi:hypothetical protein